MTTHVPTTDERHSLDRLKRLVGLAAAAALIAVAAGALLLIFDPAAGSSSEAGLGVAAALSGMTAGVLTIAAFIYAQAKGLWRLAPSGIRIVMWVFIALGIAVTMWSQISQLFRA